MDWSAFFATARDALARTLFELNQTPVTALSLLPLVLALPSRSRSRVCSRVYSCAAC